MKSDHNLQAWDVLEEGFPVMASSAEKLQFLVNYAILAPSTHNTQPWIFHLSANEIELYADRQRTLPVADPEQRELTMSCGAALCNLRVAMQHFGYVGEVDLLPDPSHPDLLARARLGVQAEDQVEDNLLFQAIVKRRTNRQQFREEPVPDALLEVLEAAAEKEGAWLHLVEGEETRYGVADLVAEADRIQWSDRAFRQELAAWLHPNHRPGRDGIPGYAEGLNDFQSYAGPLVIRTFDMGKGQAVKDRDIAVYSPVLAVLATEEDTPRAWLAAGQALERVLLRARVEDVWASFLNQAVEVPEIRTRLRDLVNRPGVPQTLLRLGFGPEAKATPRRWAHEVLFHDTHGVRLTVTPSNIRVQSRSWTDGSDDAGM